MLLRRSLVFLVATLAHGALAGTEYTLDITLGGSKIGTNTYQIEDDGSFRSTSALTMSGTAIESGLTISYADGKLANLDYSIKANGNTTRMMWSDNKWTVAFNGTADEKVKPPKPSFVFSNYHPATYRAFLPAWGKADPISRGALILESLTVTPFLIKPLPTNRIEIGELGRYEVEIGGLKIQVATTAPTRHIVGFDVPVQQFAMVDARYSAAFKDPVDAYPELSRREYKTRLMQKVDVPMRDGVRTVADIVLPDAEGKFPTILLRTPYGRESSRFASRAEWWASRGYVVVNQDVRGRGDSDGAWDPFIFERKDGYDTIDWISRQPWSDGKVGMTGGSYVGMVQWQAAVERHPALKCIIPQVSPPDAFFNLPYDHGIFMLYGNLWWANIVKNKVADMSLFAAPKMEFGGFKTLPLTEVDNKVLGVDIPFFDAWVRRDRPSAHKGWNYQADLKRVTIPALMISGWWDGDNIGTRMNWQIMRSLGRKNQWLIYGPWEHGFNVNTKFLDEDYGAGSILELESLYLRWFDTWLKGKEVGLNQVPKTQIFMTGANRWLKMDGWPSSTMRPVTAYLGAVKSARGAASDRTLTLDAKPKGADKSAYDFDPFALTVPATLAAATPTSLAVTRDSLGESTLFFQTEPFTKPTAVLGPFDVDLFVSTTAKDADFFATLYEVRSDGTCRVFGGSGKMRASYYRGWEKRTALKAGQVVRLRFPIWDSAREFAKGTRLALSIRSDQFPGFARNLGELAPDATATKGTKAVQTIWHNAKYPSSFRFYTLP
jgi:hypothetical protein